MKIAVLRGGRSAERDVSLRSGAQVEEALRLRGHEVTGIDLDARTWDVLRDGNFACVFNALHGLPLVVKPVREGSTIGITIARDADQVASGLVLARRYDRRVLVQRFAVGTEITVGVLATPDLQVLPTLEIVSDNPVYDYDAKYTAGKSHHIIPARIPEAARTAASEAAGRAFTVLGCSGMGRVDIIVDADGTPWLLEVNTVPGLTELSLLPDRS